MYICPDCKNKNQENFEYVLVPNLISAECVLPKCEEVSKEFEKQLNNYYSIKLRCLRCLYCDWIGKFKHNVFHEQLENYII